MSITLLNMAISAVLQEPLLQSSDNVATLHAVKQACALTQAWKAAIGLAEDDSVDYEVFVKANRGSPLERALRSLLTEHTVFDTRTGTRRSLIPEELSLILSASAEEVLHGFNAEFDVLSLQDAVADLPAEEMETAAAQVGLQVAEGLEAGPLQDMILCLLSDGSSADHPLQKSLHGWKRSTATAEAVSADASGAAPEATATVTEAATAEGGSATASAVAPTFHPPTYGLLTLHVLEDLLSGALQNGTSLYNPQYSTSLLPLLEEPFRLEAHLAKLPALLQSIYEELVQGEIGF
jgi:hypothetical protein